MKCSRWKQESAPWGPAVALAVSDGEHWCCCWHFFLQKGISCHLGLELWSAFASFRQDQCRICLEQCVSSGGFSAEQEAFLHLPLYISWGVCAGRMGLEIKLTFLPPFILSLLPSPWNRSPASSAAALWITLSWPEILEPPVSVMWVGLTVLTFLSLGRCGCCCRVQLAF